MTSLSKWLEFPVSINRSPAGCLTRTLPAVKPKEKLLNVFPVSIQQAARPGIAEIAGMRSCCRKRRSPEVERVQGRGRHDYEGQKKQGKTLEQGQHERAVSVPAFRISAIRLCYLFSGALILCLLMKPKYS